MVLAVIKGGVDVGWRLRFWSIFIGQSLSLLGSATTQFVLLWWIANTTGSATALATAGLAAMLPLAALAPLAGALADRYSRRSLMIMADAVSAASMVLLMALFLNDAVQLWHVHAILALRGAMQAIQAPAAAASVTMLVPTSFLSRASGLNQALESGTLIAAAPLGALALGYLPIGWALAIDVITALLGIVPLFFFAIPHPEPEERGSRSLGGLWHELREGVVLVCSSPGLRRLYGLTGAVALVTSPAVVMVPLLVKEHFGKGLFHVMLIETLSGAGMLAGGLLVALVEPRRHVRWVLFGFAASCAALALAAVAPRNMFGIGIACWVVCGLTYVLGSAPLTALLQSHIPARLQGRALALQDSVIGFAAPVGLLVAGPLGEVIGVRALFVLMGLSGACICVAGLRSKSLCRLSAHD